MNSNSIDVRRPALYIVGTPIGNLSDFSARAQQVLRSVDLILAEDTRRSRFLLKNYQIDNKISSYHDFSDVDQSGKIIKKMLEKPSAIALISDSGTPLISDPGFKLVKNGIAANIPIIPIPGPSALVACLSISDLPADKFVFEGFLSSKEGLRDRRLRELENESRSMVFYEAPHRILNFMQSVEKIMGGDRHVVVAREMTKIHETFYRGSVSEVLLTLVQSPFARRGEFTVIVGGAAESPSDIEVQVDDWLRVLLQELDIKTAVKILTKITKARRNLIYERALYLSKCL